ncbi:tyrosine-protein phosphatase [Roseibacillus persicicus]|uniref:fused DSP-PTPase phosphatase/NAD kinase-like protein n=1 Tax=Roseibacillus persicicus TaxID=454148 RepID=UPI00398AC2EB
MKEPRAKLRIFSLLFLAPFLLPACTKAPALSSGQRPAKWAQPISLAGVPNLHQVSSELYRSAQPTAEGMAALEEKGVRTVINLRAFSDDEEEVSGTTLKTERIPILTWSPDGEDDDRFLHLLENSPKPILVHCKHGSDRTGAMCAIYRIEKQGWSSSEAIAEMTSGGYGFHRIWHHLPGWVKEGRKGEE